MCTPADVNQRRMEAAAATQQQRASEAAAARSSAEQQQQQQQASANGLQQLVSSMQVGGAVSGWVGGCAKRLSPVDVQVWCQVWGARGRWALSTAVTAAPRQLPWQRLPASCICCLVPPGPSRDSHTTVKVKVKSGYI